MGVVLFSLVKVINIIPVMTAQRPVLWLFGRLCSGHKRLSVPRVPLPTDPGDFFKTLNLQRVQK